MVRCLRGLALFLVLAYGTASFGAPAAPGKRGRLTPPPHSISRDNFEALRVRLAAGALAPRKVLADTTRFVVLRIEFPDQSFGGAPPGELHDRFYYQTQFEYVTQYYRTASATQLDLQFDVADVVAVAAQPQAVYGDFAAYDSLMVELASEAIAAADPLVDFSSAGGVIVVHAGPGQESDIAGDSPFQIWSGFLDDRTVRDVLSTPDSAVEGIPTGDGVFVRNFAVLPESEVQDLQVSGGTRLGSLGVYAHEIGQSLGMIPLFDASPRFPDSQGLGNFDVMAYGLWVANGFIPSLPSAFNRMLMGWVRPVDVDAGTVVLRDQERGPADSVVARVPISEREYYLVTYVVEDPDGPVIKSCAGTPTGPRRFFEFDDKNANCVFDYEDLNGDGVLSPGDLIDTYAGAEWDFFMSDFQGSSGGSGYGLLVLHVDEAVLQEVLARGSTNVEGDAARKAVDVEEADGIEDLDRAPDNPRSFGSPDDYWHRNVPFGPATIPDTRSANGAPTGLSLVLEALPDSTGQVPGGRARVRVLRQPVSPSAPRRIATRTIPGDLGADLVALPLADGRNALVVPADSGRVLLLDAHLDEAPLSDGDSSTVAPWITLPSSMRGTWVGAPAVGDLDGDGAPEVVVAVDTDSAGVAVGRLFAWHRDGSEVRDLDANPGTQTGLFASVAGRLSPAVLWDADGDGANEVYVVREDSTVATQANRYRHEGGTAWSHAVSLLVGGHDVSGPIGVQLSGGRFALAWAYQDEVRFAGKTLLLFETFLVPDAISPILALPSDRGPVRLAAGNLDAAGEDELVALSQDGVLSIRALDSTLDAARIEDLPLTDRLDARTVSPLALADTDGDGTLEILFATDVAMHVLSATGAERPGWPYPFRVEPALEREPQPGAGAGSPLVADLDGDGDPEVALQLAGGALLVWDRTGARRHDLESALPAGRIATPLVADLESGAGFEGLELAAIGRFASSIRYIAGPESLIVEPRTQIGVWTLADARTVAWGELGGGPGHAFLDARVRNVQPRPNDAGLATFVVGPNPAANEVRARVELTSPAEVRCRLYTIEGEMVREASRSGTAGTIVELVFDLRGLASGTYLARLELSTGGSRVRPVAVRR